MASLRDADGAVLTAENETGLQNLLNIVINENKNMGLELNSKKAERMLTNKKKAPNCNIYEETITKSVFQISGCFHHTRSLKSYRGKPKEG